MLNYRQRLILILRVDASPAARFSSFKTPVETFTIPYEVISILLLQSRLLKKSRIFSALLIMENAIETDESLKDDYLSLKVLLNSLGVNITDINKIKEQK